MANNNGHVTAPVGLHEVAQLLGEPLDIGSVCTSKNINKRSRIKPYPFGSYDTRLTDAVLREQNFSMRPACVEHVRGGNVGEYKAMPWKQWQTPDVNTGWMRLTDFDGYFHYAKGGVYMARISTNCPGNDRRIMLGGKGQGRITGDISFNFDPSTEVCPHEFTHPDQVNHPLSGYYFTLLFGPVEGMEDRFRAAPWVVQSSGTISEMLSTSATNERLSISLDRTRTDYMKSSEQDLDKWLAVLCLAPKIETDEDGRYVRVRDSVWQTPFLGFSDIRLVSLDMWDDGSISTDSVLFSNLNDMAEYDTPSDVRIVKIGVSPNQDFLTDPTIGYEEFICYTYGYAYRNNGGWALGLSCNRFPEVHFPGNSIINDLAQYLEYELLDSSGRSVFSGEKLVEEVHGSRYNPTNYPYNIGFEKGIEGLTVQLPTSLSAGKYKLRIRCSVRQTQDDINYNPEPPEQQVMGQLSYEYEDYEYIPYFEATGSVYSRYNETEITIS